MAINILDIEPSVIDRSLSGKTVLLAGIPKIGKSEFCAQSPNTLILDTQNGYNAHPGVLRYPLTKWTDLKTVVRQLRNSDASEKYRNIAIDVVNDAWDLCTNYICQQNGVQKIKDIPYGQGYKDRDQEFEQTLREIINLNYGLILTCHVKETPIDSSDDNQVSILAPDLDKRCLPIVNSLVDVIGVITQTWNNNESQRWLITKATPTIVAGSRWPYLDARIPFGYNELENAIVRAIQAAEKNGASVVDHVDRKPVEQLKFSEVRAEAQKLWSQLVGTGENTNPEVAATILKKIEITVGRRMKLSEFTEDQCEILNLIVEEMKEML